VAPRHLSYLGDVFGLVIFEIAKREMEAARASRHRRLFVLVGTDDKRLAEAAAEVLRGYEAAGGRGGGALRVSAGVL
jgi:Predicted P-loop ATPase fused to an acetyltransferase